MGPAFPWPAARTPFRAVESQQNADCPAAARISFLLCLVGSRGATACSRQAGGEGREILARPGCAGTGRWIQSARTERPREVGGTARRRIPLVWFPRLWHGSKKERDRWEIIGDGGYIHWPELDEDLTVAGLLAGRQSGESAESLKRWLGDRKRRKRKWPDNTWLHLTAATVIS